jgi:leucyl/phenylalanyl-tRNA--protein transferase
VPVYLLSDRDQAFPPADHADPNGLLAVGGDLRPSRLLLAYTSRIHLSRSLRKTIRRGVYQVRYDTAFAQVVDGCAKQRGPGREGTWITNEMRDAYVALHRQGFAHSAESWEDGKLQGGLYGVSLGSIFFGESMFTRAPDASKVAFAALVERLTGWRVTVIDCQVETANLARFGATPWSRERYLAALERALQAPTRRGSWELK